jgi:hypothetical protein
MNALRCQKYEFTYSYKALNPATGDQPAHTPDSPAVEELNDKVQGTLWIADEPRVPVKLEYMHQGIIYTWELTHILPWVIKPKFFEVPDGYAVTNGDTYVLPQPGLH